MTTFEEMQTVVKELYMNSSERQWLFTHTTSQDEFAKIRRALKTLVEFEPVNWVGKTGNRRPTPCRNNQPGVAYGTHAGHASVAEVI